MNIFKSFHGRLFHKRCVVLRVPKRGLSTEDIDEYDADPRPQLLYMDQKIVVASKSGGLLSQPGVKDTPNLWNDLVHYIAAVEKKPPSFLATVHRLDKCTSGLMVFARTSKAAYHLTEQFAKKKVIKKYLAVVKGITPTIGTCHDYISNTRDSTGTDIKVEISDELPSRKSTPPDGYYEAILHYRTLGYLQSSMSLLEVKLDTGRKHQIRAQLANLGHGIIGDSKYDRTSGIFTANEDMIALHACELGFYSPTVTTQFMTYKDRPPRYWDEILEEEYMHLIDSYIPLESLEYDYKTIPEYTPEKYLSTQRIKDKNKCITKANLTTKANTKTDDNKNNTKSVTSSINNEIDIDISTHNTINSDDNDGEKSRTRVKASWFIPDDSDSDILELAHIEAYINDKPLPMSPKLPPKTEEPAEKNQFSGKKSTTSNNIPNFMYMNTPNYGTTSNINNSRINDDDDDDDTFTTTSTSSNTSNIKTKDKESSVVQQQQQQEEPLMTVEDGGNIRRRFKAGIHKRNRPIQNEDDE